MATWRRNWFGAGLPLGRWGGLSIRAHWLLVLLIGGAAWLFPTAAVVNVAGRMPAFAGIGLGLLAVSVLIHELGHYVVAREFGRAPHQIVLGPMCGLSEWRFGGSARLDWWWAVAGPLANLLVAGFCLAGLAVVQTPLDWAGLVNPLRPAWTVGRESLGVQTLRIAIWLNWLMFLLNLLPVYPFDGARAIHGLMLRIRRGTRPAQIAEATFWVALAVAVTLLYLAVVVGRSEADFPFPSWLALILLAVVVLISATRDLEHRVRRPRRPVAGRRPARLPVAHQPEAREVVAAASRVEPLRSEISDAGWDERHLDELLRRVHALGMEGLSERERAELEEASRRYRARRMAREGPADDR